MPPIRKRICLPKYLPVSILVCAVMSLASPEVRAQTGSNGKTPEEPDGMVSVNIKAHQCPSADLAMVWVENQIWFPSPAKDGCQEGAAGMHTFTLKPGFSGPLTVYPIEAIDQDDGTVSLWWSIWSDDPVWVDGSTGTVSGGSRNIAPQSHHIAASTLELKSVVFSGIDVLRDDGSAYPLPHWQQSIDPDYAASPVAFVRNSFVGVSVNFQITSGMSGGTIYIKGDGPDNLDFAPKAATLSGETLTMTFTSESPLPDEVALFDPFTITWEYALEAATTSWATAGISENQVYVTLGTPLTSVYHTLVHLGCKNAPGESTETGTLTKIWEEFTDLTVTRVDGTPLFYWGSYATANPIFSTEGLLEHADGRCGAWARFLVDVLKVQGMNNASVGTIIPKDTFIGVAQGFYVKNWDITTSPPTDLSGIPGQGINQDPKSTFTNHAVVVLDGSTTIYDPSYGKTYPNLAAWEDASIDLFGYQHRVNGEEFTVTNTLGDEQTQFMEALP